MGKPNYKVERSLMREGARHIAGVDEVGRGPLAGPVAVAAVILDPADLPIRICLRVPHLTSEAALALVEDEITKTRPVLVVIDPLYLAARGARGSDLYEMGAHLEGIQIVSCIFYLLAEPLAPDRCGFRTAQNVWAIHVISPP